MSPEIYILREGRREGPYSETELFDLVDSGEVFASDTCIVAREESEETECPAGVLVERISPGGQEEREARPDDLRERATAFLEEGECEDEDEDEDEEGEAVGGGEEEEGEEPAAEPVREVLYRGRPSWVGFWRSISVSVAAVAAGAATWSVNGWILFGALVLAFILHVHVCLRRSLWLYVVTRRRVEVIHGLVSKSSHEVRIQDIRTINVHKPGFKGLIGVGTVDFSSAGGEGVEVKFRDVWGANRVKTLVRKLQDAGG